jgi:pimeloyl-ACP methyl ester carboxylesterase
MECAATAEMMPAVPELSSAPNSNDRTNVMTPTQFAELRKVQHTPSGTISYVEQGSGPVALFVHGFPLNGYHWRHQIEGLSDIRRCVAPDLLGLGFTEVTTNQSLRFDAQAQMLREFIDTLGIKEIDLVGNDSGGAIAQILATGIPDRIRSLTLTNCDVHDNWPPPAFLPLFQLAKAGQLGKTLAGLLANTHAARSQRGLGMAFQFSERIADEVLSIYLGPIAASAERQARATATRRLWIMSKRCESTRTSRSSTNQR